MTSSRLSSEGVMPRQSAEGGIRYAAGLGLRYETPIGPIRIDAASKVNRQPTDNRRWEFYISVGQAF